MTIQEAYRQLLAQLYGLYETREAANISDWVIEYVTGLAKIDRIINKQLRLTTSQEKQLLQITIELLQNKPIQYVLNEAWFAGIKLYVDENVLIPRPETEELVHWVTGDWKNMKDLSSISAGYPIINDKYAILDVGTGSGCIAILLKKTMPNTEVNAIDVSEGALKVAEKNAHRHNADIQFLHTDFLSRNERQQLKAYDIIISNPPYIKLSEGSTMNENVVKHEPHTALFVPDDDALIFYKALAEFGVNNLNNRGSIYMEINEALGEHVVAVFEKEGYKSIELKTDMQGKQRMVKATK